MTSTPAIAGELLVEREGYRVLRCNRVEDIGQDAWDRCAGENVIMRYGHMLALQRSEAGQRKGVVKPWYLVVVGREQHVVAVAPAMIKSNTWGEYGPELAWLRYGFEAGLCGGQKVQIDALFTIACSEKLLIAKGCDVALGHSLLVEGLKAVAGDTPESPGCNVLRVCEDEAAWLAKQGFLIGYEKHAVCDLSQAQDYAQWQTTLSSRRRNQLKHERRDFAQAGLTFRRLSGDEISAELWEQFYQGHVRATVTHNSVVWHEKSYYPIMAAEQPDRVHLLVAFRGQEYVAGVVCQSDATTIAVRSWSYLRDIPGLALDLVCNRPIELAFDLGAASVQNSLPDSYKLTRGYHEALVANAYWLGNAELRAVASDVIAANHEFLGVDTIAR